MGSFWGCCLSVGVVLWGIEDWGKLGLWNFAAKRWKREQGFICDCDCE